MRGPQQTQPDLAVRTGADTCHQLVDLPIGFIQVRQNVRSIHGFGRLGETVETGVEHFLLSFHFIQQAGGDKLIGHQRGGTFRDRSRIACADDRGRGQQQDDGGKADRQNSNQGPHSLPYSH